MCVWFMLERRYVQTSTRVTHWPLDRASTAPPFWTGQECALNSGERWSCVFLRIENKITFTFTTFAYPNQTEEE